MPVPSSRRWSPPLSRPWPSPSPAPPPRTSRGSPRARSATCPRRCATSCRPRSPPPRSATSPASRATSALAPARCSPPAPPPMSSACRRSSPRLTVQRYPVNQFTVVGELATPRSNTVVAPNHDTLYAGQPAQPRERAAGDRLAGHRRSLLDPPAARRVHELVRVRRLRSVARQRRDDGARPAGLAGAAARRRPRGAEPDQPSCGCWAAPWSPTTPTSRPPARCSAATRSPRSAPGRPGSASRRSCSTAFPPTQQRVVLPTGLAFFDALVADLASDPPPAQDACAMAEFAKAGIVPGQTPSASDDPLVTSTLAAAAAAGDRIVDTAVTAERRDSQRAQQRLVAPGRRHGQLRQRLRPPRGHGAHRPGQQHAQRGRVPEHRHRHRRSHPRRPPPLRGVVPRRRPAASARVLVADRLQQPDPPLAQRPSTASRSAIARPGCATGRAARSSSTSSTRRRPPASARTGCRRRRAGSRSNLRLYEPEASAVNGRWTPPTVAPVG